MTNEERKRKEYEDSMQRIRKIGDEIREHVPKPPPSEGGPGVVGYVLFFGMIIVICLIASYSHWLPAGW